MPSQHPNEDKVGYKANRISQDRDLYIIRQVAETEDRCAQNWDTEYECFLAIQGAVSKGFFMSESMGRRHQRLAENPIVNSNKSGP